MPQDAVLVTGAAGAIGRATVRAFGDAGYAVVGFDVAAAGVSGADMRTVDVTDERAVASAVAALERDYSLCHVVGVAGGACPLEPQTQDDPVAVDLDTFRTSIENNLTSQFVVLRACTPLLRRAGRADRSITLTSSWNALTGQGMPAYSAAKAGLHGLVRALAHPLGRDRIRLNAVAPGTVRTPRTERIWSDSPGHFERLGETSALDRVGEPDDVAAAFVALALYLRHVTGHVLVVDGGQMLWRH